MRRFRKFQPRRPRDSTQQDGKTRQRFQWLVLLILCLGAIVFCLALVHSVWEVLSWLASSLVSVLRARMAVGVGRTYRQTEHRSDGCYIRLADGVTACAAFLATKVAEIASVSARELTAAQVLDAAYTAKPELRRLMAEEVFDIDWQHLAQTSSRESGAIIDRFYTGLQDRLRYLKPLGACFDQ
ncbi:hypothetical protein VTK26DRAFT_8541 [Humicola hyalothermophila]